MGVYYSVKGSVEKWGDPKALRNSNMEPSF